MGRVFYEVKLLAKTSPAPAVLVLRFEKPSGFEFAPGQFVQFKVPQSENFVLRPLSIASRPSEPHLEFATKIIPGGQASVYFTNLSVGESAQITKANGVFICRPEHAPRKVFVATGTGLAPFASMIPAVLEVGGSDSAVELLFGVRSEADLFWVSRLETWARRLANFKYQITLSQPGDSWPGLRGWVSEHLLNLVQDAAEYYICGGLEMVKDVRAMLLGKGVGAKTVHFEIF